MCIIQPFPVFRAAGDQRQTECSKQVVFRGGQTCTCRRMPAGWAAQQCKPAVHAQHLATCKPPGSGDPTASAAIDANACRAVHLGKLNQARGSRMVTNSSAEVG